MTEGALSLTKHYVFRSLINEIAAVRPGMAADEVALILQSPHHELYDDLFQYDSGGVVDSLLMEVCRTAAPGAARLVWVSLVAADSRLQRLISSITDKEGRIVRERYSTSYIEVRLAEITDGASRKAASNIAHYFEQARILIPERYGPEIVGVETFLDTSSAVSPSVAHLADLFGWANPVDDALNLGVHSWLNLTRLAFEEAWKTGAAGGVLFDDSDALGFGPSVELPPSQLNRPYLDENEDAGISSAGPREFDPDVLERALKSHKATQNALAAWARVHDLSPLRPDGEPKFDVAWWDEETFVVAEVKSVREENESHQVRLGLGQVLDYRLQLEGRDIEVRAILVLSAEPLDRRWSALCEYVDVTLTWPPFENLGKA